MLQAVLYGTKKKEYFPKSNQKWENKRYARVNTVRFWLNWLMKINDVKLQALYQVECLMRR